MNISFYLKRPKATDETAIFAILFWEGHKLKVYTPERINPKHWSADNQRAKQSSQFKEHPEFNQRLKNWKTDVANVYRRWVNDNSGTIPGPDTVKELIDTHVTKKEPKKEVDKTFFGYFEHFVQKSMQGERLSTKTKKSTVYNTTKGYTSTLNHLKAFQKKYSRKIDFKTIDLEFYNDYIKYLTKTLKLSTNTIGDHIKRIKTIMNEATELGLNNNMTYRSKYFVKPTEQTDSIYLSEKELQEIEAVDLSHTPKLERVRDLFLVGCYTGLRYSDFSILRPEQIKDGFIETTQLKTGDAIVVPIHPTVERILSKYGGELPPAISNQKTNDYLKEIGKLKDQRGKSILPSLSDTVSKTFTKGGMKVTENYQKWELLSTHTARRSFATNEYLAGTPSITIMAITGHKTEKAFLRYIKLTPKEHAKLMQLHWKKRGELKAV
jgi:integrase